LAGTKYKEIRYALTTIRNSWEAEMSGLMPFVRTFFPGTLINRDQILGSQYNIGVVNHVNRQSLSDKLELLMKKLAEEIAQNLECHELISNLQFYHKKFVVDDIVGLEAKLRHTGRSDQVDEAIMQKEEFVKLLEKYSLFQSAQKIFSHCLSMAHHEFRHFIHPQVGTMSIQQIDQLVTTRIVEPLVRECTDGEFFIDHNIAMGLVYWLAEQCYVRWHK
jgi:hypothetical protein